ncbi:MAG TPA: hypothetical protein VHI71_05630 [Actinomycetota bacterium]|nr:hypothetical protein [Actinomycetota bacterium]
MKAKSKLVAVRAVLGAVLLASTLCPAGPASAALPVLGAHNTFTAVRDGSVDVVLPRDVDLPLKTNHRAESGPAPWITFEGGGRVTGIVLISRGSTDAVSHGLVATRFRSCRRGCSERPVNALMINGKAYRGSETLHSGEYRLYVFTDRDEVTISLDLPQLTRGANIEIGNPGFADIRTPAVSVEYRDGATAYSAHASYAMKTRAGIFMSVNVMHDENYRDASFDECFSPDHTGPDELEEHYCAVPFGGFHFVRPLDPLKIEPKRGGFILTTFVGLGRYNWPEEVFNGDTSLNHYSFRVISPGSIGELWSQGVLLSL